MGVDFISSTVETSTKAWRAEFKRGSDDMFAQSCKSIDRTFLAELTNGNSLKEGDLVSIRLINSHVIVYRELSADAEIKSPSLDLLENLQSCYGILPGYIEETNDLARVVSVHIGERSGQ